MMMTFGLFQFFFSLFFLRKLFWRKKEFFRCVCVVMLIKISKNRKFEKKSSIKWCACVCVDRHEVGLGVIIEWKKFFFYHVQGLVCLPIMFICVCACVFVCFIPFHNYGKLLFEKKILKKMTRKFAKKKIHLPQNGMPSGVQVPFWLHARLDGPSNS